MSDDTRSDAELIDATAAGDTRAFAALVRRHIRAGTLLATQLTGDQDDAEDVVQEAFTVVHERLDRFDRSRAFSPWLYGVVRRIAHDRRRRAARRRRLLYSWWRGANTEAATTAENADDAVAMGEVATHLGALPPMQRACFELVALYGLSPAEVGGMHGVSESTVRQHVFRARRRLRSELVEGAVSGAEATEDDHA